MRPSDSSIQDGSKIVFPCVTVLAFHEHEWARCDLIVLCVCKVQISLADKILTLLWYLFKCIVIFSFYCFWTSLNIINIILK